MGRKLEESVRTFEKDDLLELEITDIGVDGEGIGKVEGIPLFVKDAVKGDKALVKILKMKKSYGYARLIEISEPSPYRVEPRCEFHRQCGGCQLQTLRYEKQLEFKWDKVKNNLQRIGGFSGMEGLMEPIVGMEVPYDYRNKGQFPIGRDKEGKIVAGFYASHSHHIIPNRKCHLGPPVSEQVLNQVIAFMEEFGVEPYDEGTGEGLVRHVLIRQGFASGEVMVCLVINGTHLPHPEQLVKGLRQIEGMTSITLNVNQKRTNVILGEELILLWGQTYITDSIGELQYQISPLSFYQVNPIQTEKLYKTVLEYAGLTGKETVWDLYCGIGTISLFLAKQARRVCGVEIVPQAIEDARRNALQNSLENVDFFVGRAEDVLPEFYGQEGGDEAFRHPDVIVVDPPRKGCDERCLETIANMRPKRVVYVSCDSATLARDLKWLCQRGYELKRVRPVDMFPQTGAHVESVTLLCSK